MSDSVRPHRRQPTRLPRPWDSPGKNTGVGCHFLLQCMKMKSESEVAQLCMTLCRPRLLVPVQSLDKSFRRLSPWGCEVGHDWATSLSLFTLMHWRRKWQPTPVFLPGESLGRGSLAGCCLWGHTESDTTWSDLTVAAVYAFIQSS